MAQSPNATLSQGTAAEQPQQQQQQQQQQQPQQEGLSAQQNAIHKAVHQSSLSIYNIYIKDAIQINNEQNIPNHLILIIILIKLIIKILLC